MNVIVNEEDCQPSDLTELRMAHYQYGQVARHGMLPKRLATCRIPTCSACLYSKATRRPWRGKTFKSGKEGEVAPQRPARSDRVCQPVGSAADSRINCPDIGLPYAKKVQVCDGLCRPIQPNGIRVPSGNGIGRGDPQMKESLRGLCTKTERPGIQLPCQQQHLLQGPPMDGSLPPRPTRNTVAGVNVHHQNGHAERRIRELHANACWKGSITLNLWPYVVRNANKDAINHTPSFQDPKRRTPIDLFAGTKVSSNLKNWKPLGSPFYILETSS